MAIKKKEFADRMAENGGTTKKAAYKAVEAFIDTLIIENLFTIIICLHKFTFTTINHLIHM